MTVEQMIDGLRGLSPRTTDAKVAGVLAGKVDPEHPIFVEALAHRADLVTRLREEKIWPAWVRI